MTRWLAPTSALWFAMGLIGLFGISSAGAATPACMNKPATIVGTSGNDSLKGTKGADVILGLGGDDRIWGADGNDYVCGSAGRDLLYGGDDDDFLNGGSGADHLFGGRAIDRGDFLIGGPGDDWLAGQDNFFGDATADTLDYSAARGPIRADSKRAR